MGRDVDEWRRYAELVGRTLCAAPLRFAGMAESCGAVQVERGVVYPRMLCGPGAVDDCGEALTLPFELAMTPRAVVDALGHRRPGYRGLLFHSVFRAIAVDRSGGLRDYAGRWVERLAEQMAGLRWPEHGGHRIPAAIGAVVADAVWMMLAAREAVEFGGEASWPERAGEAFGRLAACQHPQGTFLTPTASDNPETHWYHELVVLHAATVYAAQAQDEELAAAIARNAEFHLNETQPDHATNQPWGLAAFARNPSTRPVADGMLHAAATIGRGSGVTSILLADALYCLRLWTASSV
jgi:hypothetical protein